MKITSLFFAAFFAISISSFAKTDATISTTNSVSSNVSFQANMFLNASGQVAVIIKKEDDDKLTLNIKNQYGDYVYTQNIRRENYVMKRYDISQLPVGKYLIEIRRGNEVFTREISIK